MASVNAPLTIVLPPALLQKLDAEAKKRGVERTMLLLEAALGAVIDPPKVTNQDNAVQVSFRIAPSLRQKLAKVARERETSISQLLQETLKRRIDSAPW